MSGVPYEGGDVVPAVRERSEKPDHLANQMFFLANIAE
jgi:hypothetical protein